LQQKIENVEKGKKKMEGVGQTTKTRLQFTCFQGPKKQNLLPKRGSPPWKKKVKGALPTEKILLLDHHRIRKEEGGQNLENVLNLSRRLVLGTEDSRQKENRHQQELVPSKGLRNLVERWLNQITGFLVKKETAFSSKSCRKDLKKTRGGGEKGFPPCSS